MIIRTAINGLNRWVFPRNCTCCSRHLFKYEKGICSICMAQLPIFNNIQQSTEILHDRTMGRVQLQQAFSWLKFYRGGPTQKILHAIKYKGKSSLAVELGQQIGQFVNEYLEVNNNTFLVPVPLHPLKQQMRGFNQSEKLADGISKVTQIPVLPKALQRTEFHLSQTQKGKDARWEEIKNDFHANIDEVRGRDIILVDDVCTSGSTIEACAKALIDKDVRTISLMTLAIAGENYK